jgi:hypothetical protein
MSRKPGATKALLLSALVFPGAGHMYLKRRRTAAVLFVITLICLWIIVGNAYHQAITIINQLQAQGLAIDTLRIAEISVQVTTNSTGASSSLALFALLACWIFAIVDCYRLAKKADV